MYQFIPSSKFFKITEFVPQEIYNKFLDSSWMLLDARILYSIEQLRINLNKPIIVNNWKSGGEFRYRGFRPIEYKCSQFSQHKFGRALDFDVVGMTAEEVRLYILKNQSKYKYITRIEDKVNWVHIDCANGAWNGIYLFSEV